MKKIKLPKINLKSIWETIEHIVLGSILLFLFFGAIAMEAFRNDSDAQKEYPKKIELGLGDNIKSSLVVVDFHEYIVSTYTTKTGAGISTIHNQSCKFCKSKKVKK